MTVHDRSYRWLHGLDQPAARIEPVLTAQRCRRWRALRLADGTLLCRGATFGVLHLDNARALALHDAGRDPVIIGFEFRRLFLTSLRALAARATDDGPLAHLQAYSVATLFHHCLPILGFAFAPGDTAHIESARPAQIASRRTPARPTGITVPPVTRPNRL